MKKNLTVYIIGIIGVVLTVGLILMTVLVASGSFRFRKTKLVIQTASASKSFDGRPLKSKKWNLVSGKLSEEHELEVEVRGEQVNVGKSDNYASVVVRDTSGMDVTDQYDIELLYGELEVYRRKLTFESDSNRAIYDGAPHSFEFAILTSGWLAGGETWEGYDFVKCTEAGRYKNTFKVKVTNGDGEDVTENYEITYEPGDLVITYGELVIESGSDSKEYDGTPLQNTEYQVLSGILQPGHRIEIKTSGSITVSGMANNELDVRIYDASGMDVTHLYELTCRPGVLTVTPRTLIILTKDVTRPYYDTVVANDWELVAGELVEGDRLEVVTLQQSFSLTQPGMYDNLVYSYSIWGSRRGDVSDCYRVSYLYGTVVLTD